MKNYQGNEDSWIEAVGEVEGKRFEVHRVTYGQEFRYAWRIIENGEITLKSGVPFETVGEAVDAVVLILIPDAVPVEYREPTEQDYEALNALLYCGGANGEIKSFQEAVQMYMDFIHGMPVMEQARQKIASDLDKARKIVMSTHGPMNALTQDLSKMAEAVDAQCHILAEIADRNVQTLRSFILEFLS